MSDITSRPPTRVADWRDKRIHELEAELAEAERLLQYLNGQCSPEQECQVQRVEARAWLDRRKVKP